MCSLVQPPRCSKKLCVPLKSGTQARPAGVIQSEIRGRTMKPFLHSKNPEDNFGFSGTNKHRELRTRHPAETPQKLDHWPWSLEVWSPALPLPFISLCP